MVTHPMAQRVLWGLLGLWMLLWCGVASAQHVSWVPDPRPQGGWVVDGAQVLESRQSQINALIDKLERDKGAEVAVVVLPTIDRAVPKDFATALFNHWGVGKKGKDNGVLVLHVVDQRRVEIEVGYGLESAITDARAKWIIDDVTIPFFKQSSFADGHYETVRALDYMIRQPGKPRAELSARVSTEPGTSVQTPSSGSLSMMSPARRSRVFDVGLPGLGLGLALLFIWWLWLLLRVRKMDPMEGWRHLNEVGKLEYLFSLVAAVGLCIILDLDAISLGSAGVVLGSVLLTALWRMPIFAWLRRKPRICEDCGKKTRCLDEKEDDEFLKAGQVTEERIGSVDYDVWLCECGWKRADAYVGRLKYSACGSCGYRTWYEASSTVTQAPTYTSTGQRCITHRCEHCGNVNTTYQTIPMLVKSEPSSSSSSSYSSGSSSSSGGSWGGGSSGGGGAGGSY